MKRVIQNKETCKKCGSVLVHRDEIVVCDYCGREISHLYETICVYVNVKKGSPYNLDFCSVSHMFKKMYQLMKRNAAVQGINISRIGTDEQLNEFFEICKEMTRNGVI